MMRALVPTCCLVLLASGCEPRKPNVVEKRREQARERAQQARRALRAGPEAMESLRTASELDEGAARRVVARVGGERITLGDVAETLERQPLYMRARYATPDKRQKLLQRLVELHLLALEARDQGLHRKPEVQQAHQRALARELLRTGVNAPVSMSEISDEEVRDYYEAHRERFTSPSRRRIAILETHTEQRAHRLHRKLRERLEQEPGDAEAIFRSRVEEASVDRTTRREGGDVGWIGPEGRGPQGIGRVSERVAKHAFRIDEVGGLSEPFRMEDGSWAILQLTERKASRTRPLDEVELAIRNELVQQRQRKARERFLEQLRSGADVSIDEEALERLTATDAPEGRAPEANRADEASGTDVSGRDVEASSSDAPREDVGPASTSPPEGGTP